MSDSNIQEAVKQKYAEAAKRVASGNSACCGGTESGGCDSITKDLYSDLDRAALPEEAMTASLARSFALTSPRAAPTSSVPPAALNSHAFVDASGANSLNNP